MIGRYFFKEEKAEPQNMRTVGSIEDTLISAIGKFEELSGPSCGLVGVIRIARERHKNPEFAAALKLVAETVLGLFPNQK